MGAFGPMLDAATQFGRGAAQMWETLNATYQAAGLERPHFATLADMNTFRAGLGGFTRSIANLGAADDADVLGPQHYAYPIGYEPTAADFAAPSLTATFEVSITTAEGEVTRWSSTTYTRYLPATVGQLRNEAIGSVQGQLDASAMEEGEESPTAGGQVTGLGRMYLTARGL